MKKIWKILIILLAVVLILIVSRFIGMGFSKNIYVKLDDFTISEDGKEMIFTIYTNASVSNAYVRGFDDVGDGEEAHYLDFYNTFGIDFPWGAKNEYVLALDDNDKEIYFNRINGGYELVLIKDGEGGTWRRPIAEG